MTHILAFPGMLPLGENIAALSGAQTGEVDVHRFPDGESLVTLPDNLAGEDVAVLATLRDPDPLALPLRFAAETARQLGARRVGLIAPYLAYMRQDRRFAEGQAVSAPLFARFLEETFDWLVTSEMSIYCVVIAGVWQSTGFVMAMFLAGLRGIDDAILKAAQVDGASLTRIYGKIIIPSLRPVFFSTIIILTHIAIKSFDLVVVLTGGGPGYASDLPATFMYSYAFTRGQLAMGAASAMMMFCMVMAIIVPYLYSELRRRAYA